ncbi:hypothetical protein PR202_gb20930 [Eleusine coracana subsp. coracana]|uniref:Endonuclease/exonuclease/phosphatase domain-containing protein n=1 Tax=Eleusine coracana subsp. coracana TaxID=191504 RepID=A0AAV5FBS4_ELECO|nr:hypothetical protein PR202_gb20930 [Eleusine coracana subsp. coracana]
MPMPPPELLLPPTDAREPPKEPKGQIKFMTYNVLSREDVVVYKRMQAIGASVGYHKPDVIFFQVKHRIDSYSLTNFARWKFANSPTGRSYLKAEIYPEPQATKPIRIARTQLEFANPPAPMWCLERYVQAEHAVTFLNSAENVVFGGDMCWRDDTDRPFPLLAGWIDAWSIRFPRDNSWTYNGLWNE